MITIGMNYQVLPGKEDAFETKFRDVLATFERGAGHCASHLYREIGAQQTYLIHSEWETREACQEFIRSDAFRSAVRTAASGESLIAASGCA